MYHHHHIISTSILSIANVLSLLTLIIGGIAVRLAYNVAIKQIKLAALQANINTLTQEISTANNQRNHLENKLNEEMNNDKMRQLRFDIGVIDTKTVNYINLRNKAIDEYNIEIKKIIN